MSESALVVALLMLLSPLQTDGSSTEELLTVAEASDYQATASSDQVEELVQRINSRSSVMRVSELGRTSEDRAIPLVILADPPLDSPDEAAQSGKPVVFVLANIHAGEVCGKEAALMLIRELALEPDHPFLKELVVVLVPNYNADGNDRFGPVEENRRGQVGPLRVGQRPNAQELDLNRDYIKLESPEARALVKFFTEWDPHVSIDCHTTNGSRHRYVLTYDIPLNPSGHPEPIAFVRDELLPEVTKRVRERTGYEMFFYGNFNRDQTVWETYSPLPRFGGSYQGLRGQMSILSEAYSYAPFKDRVLATRELIRDILQYTIENKDRIIEIHNRARHEITIAGRNPQPDDVVGLRHRPAAYPTPIFIKGFEKFSGGLGGAVVDPNADSGEPKDLLCVHQGRFEPILSVRRPFAYLIENAQQTQAAVNKLREHGIQVESFSGAARVEVYTVTDITKAEREFQGHRNVSFDVEANTKEWNFKSATLIRTAQPLGTLAVYLLEPQSDDGLVTWNFFDDAVTVGEEFPVYRVSGADDLKP